jgi:tetratricopeptide (TPR) repeat protein
MFLLAHSNAKKAESYLVRSSYFLEQREDFNAAEVAAREGLVYAENLELRSNLLSNLGGVLAIRETSEEAVAYLRKAVEIHKKIRSDNLTDSLGNLATALEALGKYHESLMLQEEAISLLRQKGEYSNFASYLRNYSVTLNLLGYIRQGLNTLEEALELQRKMQGVEVGIGRTLLALGQFHRELCQFKDALKCLKEALEIASRNADSTEGFYTINLGYVYLLLGQQELSKRFFDDAMNNMPDYSLVRVSMFRIQAFSFVIQDKSEKAFDLPNRFYKVLKKVT